MRLFKPKLVAIRDASKVPQLRELIADVSPQPEILVGDEGAVEVRSRVISRPRQSPWWGVLGFTHVQLLL